MGKIIHLPNSTLPRGLSRYRNGHSVVNLLSLLKGEQGDLMFNSLVNITRGFHCGAPGLAFPNSDFGKQNLNGFHPVLNFKFHVVLLQDVFNMNELKFHLNIT